MANDVLPTEEPWWAIVDSAGSTPGPPFTNCDCRLRLSQPNAIAVYIFTPSLSFQSGKEPKTPWHPKLRQLNIH